MPQDPSDLPQGKEIRRMTISKTLFGQSLWRPMLAVLLLGIGMIVVVSSGSLSSLHWAEELLSALGEALVIAAILATTVDQYAKLRLAREVSRDVGLALFGIEAPSSYVSQLHSVLSTKIVESQLDWTLEFEWLPDDEDLLGVTIYLSVAGKNISQSPRVPQQCWLMASVLGHQSRFLRYAARTLEVTGREQQTRHIDFTEARIRQHVVGSGGSLGFDVSAVDPDWNIPAQASYFTDLVGYVVRYGRDVIPLIPYGPVLRQTLTVSGDAWKDLCVSVRTGTIVHQGTPIGEADESVRYSIDSLTLAGQTMLVSFDHKGSAPISEATEDGVQPQQVPFSANERREDVASDDGQPDGADPLGKA